MPETVQTLERNLRKLVKFACESQMGPLQVPLSAVDWVPEHLNELNRRLEDQAALRRLVERLLAIVHRTGRWPKTPLHDWNAAMRKALAKSYGYTSHPKGPR